MRWDAGGWEQQGDNVVVDGAAGVGGREVTSDGGAGESALLGTGADRGASGELVE